MAMPLVGGDAAGEGKDREKGADQQDSGFPGFAWCHALWPSQEIGEMFAFGHGLCQRGLLIFPCSCAVLNLPIVRSWQHSAGSLLL